MSKRSVYPLTWLSVVRIDRELSQRDLAQKAGVTNMLVSRLESGDRQPRMATAHKLAKALDVNPQDLFPDEDYPSPMDVLLTYHDIEPARKKRPRKQAARRA